MLSCAISFLILHFMDQLPTNNDVDEILGQMNAIGRGTSPNQLFETSLELYRASLRGELQIGFGKESQLLDQLGKLLTLKLNFIVKLEHSNNRVFLAPCDDFQNMEDDSKFIFNALMDILAEMLTRKKILHERRAGGFVLRDIEAVESLYQKFDKQF
jgi:hypothetical protein